MPDGGEGLVVRAVPGIGAVRAADWDACAGADNPFVGHAFLSALEDSGSAAPETGWLPQHLVVEDGAGRVLAAAPMYLKSHSSGEYVFDHGWAQAFERAGGRYYPKLQVSVPFTPVTGPRLLVRPGQGAAAGRVESALISAMTEVARRTGASSVHATFVPEAQVPRFAEAGWLLRTDVQFHWENHGYRTFDDFLDALSARKRKAVRRERREAAAAGLIIRALAGDEVGKRHWDAFFGFYLALADRKWGAPYLTRRFFSLVGATMPERVVLVIAERAGTPVAGALNLLGTDTLFGRYWGALEDHRFLHFEMCYHQAVEFAIARGLARVEAGAQGPHKLQRGYLPRRTFSAHWIRDPGLAAAVADFLARERDEVDREIRFLARHSPFRSDHPAGAARRGE